MRWSFDSALERSRHWYAAGYQDAMNRGRAYSRGYAQRMALMGVGDRASYTLGFSQGAAYRRARE